MPVRALLGGDLISYRMYPEGLGSLVEGWSKNLATGAGVTPPVRLAATVIWVAAALQAAISTVGAIVWGAAVPAVAADLVFALQFGVVARRLGRFGTVTALAYPVVSRRLRRPVRPLDVPHPAGRDRAVARPPGGGAHVNTELLPVVLADSVVRAGWSFVVGYTAHRLPLRAVEQERWLTRIRPWERDGRTWERLGIRRWKDRLPEAGDLFGGGVSKRALPGRHPDELARFAAETRRAELVHWTIPLVLPVFVLWNPPVLLAAMAAYAVVANSPCIAVQRFDRARILRLLRRREQALQPR